MTPRPRSVQVQELSRLRPALVQVRLVVRLRLDRCLGALWAPVPGELLPVAAGRAVGRRVASRSPRAGGASSNDTPRGAQAGGLLCTLRRHRLMRISSLL